MTCKELRKYLYAFADGELETKENLEALEHLNMCPSCCRKVSAQQELRRSVARIYQGDAAPAELRARVRASLSDAGAPRTARRGFRGIRVLVPLAAAAAVAALMLPWSGWLGRPAFASSLIERHELCWNHHSADSPSAAAAGTKLAAQLAMRVCAPDLDAQGYTFHSADPCGLPGFRGSHMFFQDAAGGTGRTVSVFSIQPKLDLASWNSVAGDGQDYWYATEGRYGLVAWECPDASHVICAPGEKKELLALARQARSQPLRTAPAVALAGWRP